MSPEELSRMINEKEGTMSHEREVSLAFPALFRKVYVWMTMALAITGLTAYVVINSESILFSLYSTPAIMWVMIIAELALVFFISSRIQKISITTATILFVLYAVINGLTLAPILLIYTGASVAKVFFITAGTFAAMAFYGYTTKSDLSKMGKIAIMALIGVIIATVVNLFMHSSTLDMIICYGGVLIFVGLTAWDTQKIKNMLAQCDEPNEQAQKIALLGSLSLYLDFINLFIYLLRILGTSRD
ncbi:MAG: Bax inhibitor-1/YccA family protein [Prevotella sp.]|nr:Bax inhibitor-1/YccA family protein [Prevotella sp.]